MALRKIVTVGDPILTKVCRPVTKFDQKLAINRGYDRDDA